MILPVYLATTPTADSGRRLPCARRALRLCAILIALGLASCASRQLPEPGGVAAAVGPWAPPAPTALGGEALPREARPDLPIEAAVLHAMLLDAAGEPRAALETILSAAPPAHALASLVQAAFVHAYVNRVPDFGAHVAAWLEDAPAGLHPAEALLRNEMHLVAAWRHHRRALATEHMDRAPWGAPAVWRVAGPLSDAEALNVMDDRAWLSGFDRIPDVLALGGQPRMAREVMETTALVNLPGSEAGVYVAEAFVTVDAPTEALLAVTAPGWVAVRFGDDEPLGGRPPADQWGPRFGMRRVLLAPGTHRVRLTMGVDDEQRGFWFRLVPLDPEVSLSAFGADFPGGGPETVVATGGAVPLGEDGWQTFAESFLGGFRQPPADPVTWLVLARLTALDGDADRMLHLIDDWLSAPDHPAVHHPAVVALGAGLLRTVRVLPRSTRQAMAIDALRSGLAAAPDAHGLALTLATLLEDERRIDDALALADAAADARPEHPEAHQVRARLLDDRGFTEEALVAWREAARVFPEHCGVVAELVAARVRRQEPFVPDALPEAWRWCDSTWNAIGSRFVRPGGDTPEAIRAARQSALRNPDRRDWMEAWIDTAVASGDQQAVEEALLAAGRSAYSPAEIAAIRADLALVRGESPRASWEESLRWRPDELGVRVQRDFAEGLPLLAAHRRDGLEAIAAWRAAGETFEGDLGVVLDQTHDAWFEDGSGLRVRHQIAQVLSREALNQVGEVGLPRGATLLTVRTIKPDGRLLVPQDIPEKDAISLPELEVGDLIEFEYALRLPTGAPLRTAVLGDRFVFRTHGVALHESTYVIDLPAAWSEGNGLTIERVAFDGEESVEEVGDRRRLTFTRRNSLPPEPDINAVHPGEWMPSVRLAYRVGWEDLREAHANRIARVTVPDARMRALAAEVNRSHRTPRAVALELFRRVMDEFEESGGWFSEPAVHGWARGNGDRGAVLVALLEAAGLHPEVVFVRSFGGPERSFEVPDMSIYDFTAIRLDLPDGVLWLEPGLDHSPAAFLPAEAQGRPARVITGPSAGAELTTPVWEPALQEDLVRFTLALEPDGQVRGEAVERYGLQSAPGIRGWLEFVESEEDLKRQLERGLSGPFREPRVTAVSVEAADARDAPLVLRFSFEARVHLEQERGLWWLDVDLQPRRLARAWAERPRRDRAMNIHRAIRERLEVDWTLPPGWQVEAPPPEQQLQVGVNRAWQRHVAEGQRMRTEREIVVPLQRVEPEDYPEVAGFLRAVEEGTRTTWSLRAPAAGSSRSPDLFRADAAPATLAAHERAVP